jgi:hypothetical protein
MMETSNQRLAFTIMASIFILALTVPAFIAYTNSPIAYSRSRVIERRQAMAEKEAAHDLTHQAELDALALEEAEATQPQRIEAARLTIQTGGIVTAVFIAAGAVIAGFWIAGRARADVMAANVKAQLIQLNEKTRQYPALLHQDKGRAWLIDPNTGQSSALGQVQSPDERLILVAGQVRSLGVQAQEPKVKVIK